MVRFLHRRLHVPRSVSAGIGVSIAFCFLTMFLLLLAAIAVRELRALTGVLPELGSAAQSGITALRDWSLDQTARMPASLRPMLQENVTALFSDGAALLDKAAAWLLAFAGNLLSHVPDSALSLGTGILSAFLISAKLPRIRRFLLRRIPRDRLQAILAGWKQIRRTLSAFLLAQAKLMGTTLLILLLGLILLRIRHAPIWALGISLVDALPVLGTGTILLPWSLLCFLQQDTARAIGLLGIYVTITLTRSILEPKFLGRHLGLDPLAALMALYVGYKLWGIPGMVLSPMLAVTALQLANRRGPSIQ